MYDIIKDIQQKVKIFVITSEEGEDKDITIPQEKLEITWFNETFPASKRYNGKKLDGCYQSCYIYAEGMNGKMSILQDYGDHECMAPEGYMEYPREIFGFPSETSLGWYDGKLYLVATAGEYLLAAPIAKFDQEIEIDKLRTKRPYNLKFVFSDKFDLDETLKVYVSISTHEDNPDPNSIYGKPHMLDYIHNMTFKDTIKPSSYGIYAKMMDLAYSNAIGEKFVKKNYVTLRSLIKKGYNYDALQQTFKKDDDIIYYKDPYFFRLKENNGDLSQRNRDYVFYEKNLK